MRNLSMMSQMMLWNAQNVLDAANESSQQWHLVTHCNTEEKHRKQLGKSSDHRFASYDGRTKGDPLAKRQRSASFAENSVGWLADNLRDIHWAMSFLCVVS